MSETAFTSKAGKYGPWAVVTGASDGTGAAYCRRLAAAGLNLVMIARRLDPLNALASELEEAHGIETRVASVDLYAAGAGDKVIAAADGLEVGLFVSNAGADTNFSQFLDAPLVAWRNLLNRNVITVTEAVYGFAGPMRARGKGGIILMSSGTALGGMPGEAIYSGTKAFDLNLGESLWAELGPLGIDVIAGVCPAMDTPTLSAGLAPHGLTIPGLYDPDDVVRTLLDRLGEEPLHIFGFGPDAARAPEQQKERHARVIQMIEIVKMFHGG